MNRYALAPLFAACLTLGGCGDSPTGLEPEPNPADSVVTVSLSPSEATLASGDTLRILATAKNASGAPITGVTFAWSTPNSLVATVSASGLVTALAEGTITIRATVGTRFGTTQIEVADDPGPTPTPGPVSSITLDIGSGSVVEGDSLVLVATAKDAEGREVTGWVAQWSSSVADVAPVNPFGRLDGIRVGETLVSVKVAGVTTQATITVTAGYGYDLVFDRAEDVGTAPELYRLDIRDVADAGARLFPAGRAGAEGVVSPDRTRIAYVVHAPGGSLLEVSDLNGEDTRTLSGGQWFSEGPTWSADGSRVAYRAWDITGPGRADIWAVAADGTGVVNLTEEDDDASFDGPAWSPDGTRIAYVRVSGGRSHVWTMKADGTDKTPITSGDVADAHPAWSPDGRTLAFERYGPTPGTSGDIFVATVANGVATRLVSLPLGQFRPAWSPDGRLVAFASDVDGIRQIFTVWADGTKVARRTWTERSSNNPSWVVR